MNCTFYRPTTINIREFENIIGKLAYDLHQLETEPQDEWNVYTFFYSLSKMALPLEKNPAMRFLGLADPKSMPSDARVDFFYRPTYIATAFMIKAVLLYPSLMDESTFLDSELDFTVEVVKNTLASCLLGCTGRNFDGAGVFPLSECVKLFKDAGTDKFLEKYPDLCPEFTALYNECSEMVRKGIRPRSERWYDHFN